MPPPIEEQEELDQHEAAADSSQQAIDLEEAPVETAGFKAVNHVRPAPGPQEEALVREASPLLVVSDILANRTVAKPAAPTRTALPSLKPSEPERRNGDKGKKRAPDTRSNTGPVAKRRRGNKRPVPCTYCVRRLANDPSWACHDALVGQSGVGSYTGFRCSECVGAHVSCHLSYLGSDELDRLSQFIADTIPSKAKEAVEALAKAAADVQASDGTDKIALLAAYEAAVGPALRAIIVIPSEKVEKVEKAPKPEKKKTKSKKPGDKLPGVSSARPQSSAPRATASTTNGRADSKRKNHSSAGPADPYHDQQQYIQAADADPSSFYAPPQQQQHHQDAGDFERLERQALRRRKVEALESLAHTAALFLAEFMTHNNNKKESSRSSPGPGEPSGSAAPAGAAQNHGVDYAAAAAGMAAGLFQTLESNSNGLSGNDNISSSSASTISNGRRARAGGEAVVEDDDGDEERDAPNHEDADTDMEDVNSGDEEDEGDGEDDDEDEDEDDDDGVAEKQEEDDEDDVRIDRLPSEVKVEAE